MSLETELKKIANNLQQLTDAMVTLTAALETRKPVLTTLSAERIGERIDDTVVLEDNVVDITQGHIQEDAQHMHEGAQAVITTVHPADNATAEVATNLTMAQANAELQNIVRLIGDGGIAVRNLLSENNAITLAQIAPESYGAFVEEARKLVPVQA